MTIQRGDYVRPNNPSVGLPRGSVWRVVCSAGALKLEPENLTAHRAPPSVTVGCRFPAGEFDKVVRCRGQWVAVNDADFLRCPGKLLDPFSEFAMRPTTGRTSSHIPEFQNLPKTQTSTVATAEASLTNAANTAAAIEGMLETARKLEAKRKAEVQAAKLAKAKADKEAAAKAKAEEAKRQLAARLHSDRCLGEATLDLIAEVSRLNNGGAEQIAAASIAAHIDQLQALAKSYGYRIAKPSMLAQVVKL